MSGMNGDTKSRTRTLALVIVLVATILTACSGNSGSSDAAGATPTTSSEPTKEDSPATPPPTTTYPPTLTIQDMPERFVEQDLTRDPALRTCHGLNLTQRYGEFVSAKEFYDKGVRYGEWVYFEVFRATSPDFWDRVVADFKKCKVYVEETYSREIDHRIEILPSRGIGDASLYVRSANYGGARHDYWLLVKSGDYIIQIENARVDSDAPSRAVFAYARAALSSMGSPGSAATAPPDNADDASGASAAITGSSDTY